MLVKDFTDLKVSLVSELSQDEFNSATKDIFKKFDYPIPVLGEDNWESFSYLVSKGIYAGSLIKRLTKWMKKDKGISPDPVFIGQIGNVVGKITNKNSEIYYVTMSNYFDWTPGTFDHNQSGGSSESGSCFWQSRNCAREALRDIYDARSIIVKNSAMDNLARCWIISAMEDDFENSDFNTSYHDIIFNAYGGLELYKIARILTYCGYSSYNKVNFYTTDDYRMYINSDVGFALSTSGEECNNHMRIDPEYEVYHCNKCGDNTSVNFDFICDECQNNMMECSECGDDCYSDEGYHTGGRFYCNSCYNKLFATCWNCGTDVARDRVHVVGGRSFCSSCYSRHATACNFCNTEVFKNDSRLLELENGDQKYVCYNCLDKVNQCRFCSVSHEKGSGLINTVKTVEYHWNSSIFYLFARNIEVCNSCKKDLIKLSDDVYIFRLELARIYSYVARDREKVAGYSTLDGEHIMNFDFELKDFGTVVSSFPFSEINVYNLFTEIQEQFKERV